MSVASRQREHSRRRTYFEGEIGSRFGEIIPSDAYNPKRKSPSRADRRRVIGNQRKALSI